MELRNTGRFEVIAKLGEGGTGIVYEVYDRLRDMPVALKLLRDVSAEHIFRFKREFRVLTRLSHPNIVTLYDLVHEHDQWLLTMELVRGDDFLGHIRPPGAYEALNWDTTSRVAARRLLDISSAPTRTESIDEAEGDDAPSSRPRPVTEPVSQSPSIRRNQIDELVDLPRLVAALAQLTDALRTLHTAGIVHRDLKPSNVRITPEGRLVLMDFGIASQLEHDRDLQQGTFAIGTPEFMAPEQVDGRMATAASDWFSFGVLMYLSLTGVLPHGGHRWESMLAKQRYDPSPPSLRVDGVPFVLEHLTMRLLDRDPRARPDGQEIALALGAKIGPALGARPEAHEDTELFVGREPQLLQLNSIFERVRRGGTACVLVQGRSGIGKTRLVERFLARLRGATPAPLVFSGRSHERESLDYKAFDGVIDALCHHLVNMPPAQRDALLPADAPLLARLFPVLRAIPACRSEHPEQWRDPDAVKRGAVIAGRELLTALARTRPVVVHTEDLQWADIGSLALLIEIMKPPEIPGFLIIATVRTEDLATGTRSSLIRAVHALDRTGGCQHIDVGPLSEPEQRTLTRALIDRHGACLADNVEPWRSSAGHPMMLAELVRHMLEAHGGKAPVQPLGLQEVIVARAARLSPPARRLLEVIAVAGEPTPASVLGAAAGLAHEQRERVVAQLRHASLIRISVRDHMMLDSYHDQIRTAITADLGERAQQLHRALALALGDHEGTAPAAIAYHWLACGQDRDAAIHLVQAAQIADDKLAFERADALRRQLLEILPDEGSTT